MRALFTQFSGLVGLLTFLNQLMSQAPLEKTIFLGLSAGLSVYLVLLIGDLAIHRILEHVPAAPPASEEAAFHASSEAEEAPEPSRTMKPKEAIAA